MNNYDAVDQVLNNYMAKYKISVPQQKQEQAPANQRHQADLSFSSDQPQNTKPATQQLEYKPFQIITDHQLQHLIDSVGEDDADSTAKQQSNTRDVQVRALMDEQLKARSHRLVQQKPVEDVPSRREQRAACSEIVRLKNLLNCREQTIIEQQKENERLKQQLERRHNSDQSKKVVEAELEAAVKQIERLRKENRAMSELIRKAIK